MKIMHSMTKRQFLLSSLAFFAMISATLADEPTALNLVKAGNDYVGKDARNKVVQIRSDKSIGSLTPVIWYVVYFDPDATFKATEVKFEAGRKTDVKRPMRMLEYPKAEKVIDLSKVKVDSDAAIKTATTDPLLKNVTLKATQLWLERDFKLDLSVDAPIWRVRLWAAKLKNPNDNTDIGEVFISAGDGQVVKRDLHIDRVD
jgi:hypothetical protein